MRNRDISPVRITGGRYKTEEKITYPVLDAQGSYNFRYAINMFSYQYLFSNTYYAKMVKFFKGFFKAYKPENGTAKIWQILKKNRK